MERKFNDEGILISGTPEIGDVVEIDSDTPGLTLVVKVEAVENGEIAGAVLLYSNLNVNSDLAQDMKLSSITSLPPKIGE